MLAVMLSMSMLLMVSISIMEVSRGVGLVSMANSGENTNKSLFFILTCYTQSER